MSDLALNIQITHGKAPKIGWRPTDAITSTQTGTGKFDQTISIGTTAENISFGDVAPGLVILWNLDSTNFVTFGQNNAGTIQPIGILYPSTNWPAMLFLKPGETLRMQADTNACNVQVIAYTL